MKAMLNRDRRLFGKGLLPALILTGLMALAMGLAAYAVFRSADEKTPPVQVALVDEEGGLVSQFCISLVRSQKFIASLMDFEEVNRNQAINGLEGGRYAAIIVLPKGYTDNIMRGKKAAGQIVLSEAAAASAKVVASVASFGETLLAAGQNGVFAGEDLLRARGIGGEAYQTFLDESNDLLLDVALNLYTDGVEVVTTPYSGSGLATLSYYAACWLSLLVLLCGLFFSRLYTADLSKPLITRLFSLGIRPAGFLCGKILYPFLFRLPVFALLLWALSRFVPIDLSASSVLYALCGLFLASAFVSLTGVALGRRGGWQGLVLGIGALGLFLGGGLVPRTMLPVHVTEIGRFMPSGMILAAFKPLFGARADIPALLAGAALFLLLAFAAWRQLIDMPSKGEEL